MKKKFTERFSSVNRGHQPSPRVSCHGSNKEGRNKGHVKATPCRGHTCRKSTVTSKRYSGCNRGNTCIFQQLLSSSLFTPWQSWSQCRSVSAEITLLAGFLAGTQIIIFSRASERPLHLSCPNSLLSNEYRRLPKG
jgi:hypothetical protein